MMQRVIWPQLHSRQRKLIAAALALALLAGLLLGKLSLMQGAAALGTLVAAYAALLLILTRQDVLLASLCVAAGVLLDWYHLISWPLGIPISFAALLALGSVGYRLLAPSAAYPWVWPPSAWLWALLMVLAIPAILPGVDLAESFDYYVYVMVIPVLMYALGVLLARDLSHVRRLLSLLAGFGTIIAIHTIIEASTGLFIVKTDFVDDYLTENAHFIFYGTETARAGSFLLNPDQNGVFLAVAAILPVGLLLESRSRLARAAYSSETVVILVALLATYSTAAMLSALGGLVLLILLAGGKRVLFFLAGLLGALAGVLSLLFPSAAVLWLTHATSASAIAQRSGAWQTALRIIAAHPLAGIGLGRTTYFERSAVYQVSLQRGPLSQAHNSYLELASQAGIPVLVVFLALLGSILWLAFQNFRRTEQRHAPLLGSILAIAAALSINSFLTAGWTLRPVEWMVWLLLGAASSPLLKHWLTSGAQPNGGRAWGAGAKAPIARSPAEGHDRSSASFLSRWSRGKLQRPLPGFANLPFSPRLQATAAGLLGPRLANRSTGASAAGESYQALMRRFVQSSGAYVLASLVLPFITLALVPFLAHYLSPTSYGILTITNTAITLLGIVTQMGLTAAFLRAYSHDYLSPRDRHDVLATTLALICLVSIPVLLGMALFAPLLARLLFQDASLGGIVLLAGGVLLAQNLTIPGLAWLRAESRGLAFALLSIGSSALVLVASFLLVGTFHLGIAGALIATGCGYASVAVSTVPLIVLRARFRLRRDMVWNLLTFGVPHVPGFLSFWLLQFSDRYLLGLLGSLADVASYSVGYSLGWYAMSFLLVAPFGLAWPTTMYAIARRQNAADLFRLVFRWFSLVLLLAALGLALIGSTVLDVLFPGAYHAAAPIIPVIAASGVLYGIYQVFMVGANVRRKPWFVAVSIAIAALMNVLLNLFLIPLAGAMGAALSTLLAYAALALIAYLGNQRIYPVPFEIGRFLGAAAGGVAIFLGSLAASQTLETGWAWLIKLLALVAYGVGLLRLGLAPRSQPGQPPTYTVSNEHIASGGVQ
jgi:O-antigen/teichoic acid export membrane protein